MKPSKLFVATVFLVCQLFSLAAPPHSQTPKLTLVAARQSVDGSFLVSQAIYADSSYVFLASFEGNLLVLQNRSPKFPLKATVLVSSLPLRSVVGDGTKIYVTCADGYLYVYNQAAPFQLIKKLSYSNVPLNSLAVTAGLGGSVMVSEWQGVAVADPHFVYLSEIDAGDIAQTSDKATDIPGLTFGNVFQTGVTQVFERTTGTQIGTLPNPTNLLGSTSQVALFANGKILAQALPGCCGVGVAIYDATTLKLLSAINEPYANTVATMNKESWLVVGTEAGAVVLYDITNLQAPVRMTSIDLRQATGHTGSEDIEIRSLATGSGGLIFAASSWGNATSKDPTLPSFFVLKAK